MSKKIAIYFKVTGVIIVAYFVDIVCFCCYRFVLSEIFCNFTIKFCYMRKISSIIPVLVLLIFALTSVMQYHQHGCDGKVHIHLTTLDDLATGYNVYNSCCSKSHNEPISQSGTHSHEADGCSMHIADYKASEYSELADDTPILLLGKYIVSPIVSLKYVESDVILFSTIVKIKSYCGHLNENFALRAPPFV